MTRIFCGQFSTDVITHFKCYDWFKKKKKFSSEKLHSNTEKRPSIDYWKFERLGFLLKFYFIFYFFSNDCVFLSLLFYQECNTGPFFFLCSAVLALNCLRLNVAGSIVSKLKSSALNCRDTVLTIKCFNSAKSKKNNCSSKSLIVHSLRIFSLT